MSVNVETVSFPAKGLGLTLRWAILVAALLVAGFVGAIIGSRVIGGPATQNRQPPSVVVHDSSGAPRTDSPNLCGPLGGLPHPC